MLQRSILLIKKFKQGLQPTIVDKLSEPELDDPKQMLPFHEVEDLKLQASLSEVGPPHIGVHIYAGSCV
jgi:hypothetical protein